MADEYLSWGKYPQVKQNYQRVSWVFEKPDFNKGGSFLPYGLGRSYGDCCLNDSGTVLLTRDLNRLIRFDRETGLLKCEAGVSLAEIIRFALPLGWFLPVTPGTKFVTVGGAIANDVHGKNHHCSGTFGCHIKSFELLRSNGVVLNCSPENNSELFRATIGGIGLTGLILSAEIQLKKVEGPLIDMESIKFGSLEEFFEISKESDKNFEYTVAWLDCVANGQDFGRGIFMRGNHSKVTAKRYFRPELPLTVPFNFPDFALNNLTVRAFNFCYYGKQREKFVKSTVNFEPFFYPLDIVSNWNRIYGRRGFLQFQCVIPESNDITPVKNILKTVVNSGKASFLAVFKEFGSLASPGLLSFPFAGATLCLDFPNSESTRKLLLELDTQVLAAGGRSYTAKDAVLPRSSFQSYYPKLKEFKEYKDPLFSSSMWRRLGE